MIQKFLRHLRREGKQDRLHARVEKNVQMRSNRALLNQYMSGRNLHRREVIEKEATTIGLTNIQEQLEEAYARAKITEATCGIGRLTDIYSKVGAKSAERSACTGIIDLDRPQFYWRIHDGIIYQGMQSANNEFVWQRRAACGCATCNTVDAQRREAVAHQVHIRSPPPEYVRIRDVLGQLRYGVEARVRRLFCFVKVTFTLQQHAIRTRREICTDILPIMIDSLQNGDPQDTLNLDEALFYLYMIKDSLVESQRNATRVGKMIFENGKLRREMSTFQFATILQRSSSTESEVATLGDTMALSALRQTLLAPVDTNTELELVNKAINIIEGAQSENRALTEAESDDLLFLAMAAEDKCKKLSEHDEQVH